MIQHTTNRTITIIKIARQKRPTMNRIFNKRQNKKDVTQEGLFTTFTNKFKP